MAKIPGGEETLCPLARATAIVGDRWTFLVLRELFSGVSRFDEIQAQTGASAQMLADRLKRLEAEGMVERRIYNPRPVRHEYMLTRKGQEFSPILFTFRQWGETWCKTEDEPVAVEMTHRKCGTAVHLDGFCPTCRELVARADMDAGLSPEYAEERRVRQEAYKIHTRSRTQHMI